MSNPILILRPPPTPNASARHRAVPCKDSGCLTFRSLGILLIRFETFADGFALCAPSGFLHHCAPIVAPRCGEATRAANTTRTAPNGDTVDDKLSLSHSDTTSRFSFLISMGKLNLSQSTDTVPFSGLISVTVPVLNSERTRSLIFMAPKYTLDALSSQALCVLSSLTLRLAPFRAG